jgi:asparagine synthase (glutamine-hydrolysing)
MIETHALEQGIEVRFPFFDLRLIEFCVCLPLEEKNKNGINRYILRKAMKGIVPEKILNRIDKSNIGAFAKKEIKEVDHDEFFSSLKQKNILSDIVEFNYFNDVIKKNIETDSISNNNDLSRYYLLYSLNYWLESLENP